jgi:hypothetical protein
MKFVTLDQIVRGALDSRGLTIHWYWDFMKHASVCLRELNLHHLRNIRSKILEIDKNGEAKLPCDYVDYVRVLAGISEVPIQMVRYPEMNRLPNIDEEGNQIPYPPVHYGNMTYHTRYLYRNRNFWGEYLGGDFGYNGTSYYKGFEIIRERCVIRFTSGIRLEKAVMDYIGDGSGCDAANKVHPYAQQSIEDYIDWYTEPQQRGNWLSPKAQKYKRSVEILRASLDPITTADISAIFNNAEIAAPK